MVFVWILTVLLVVGVFGYVMFLLSRGPRRRAKREKIVEQPFPEEWQSIVERRCKFYERMPLDLQQTLQKHVQVFLAEKKFEACGDLREVTDEMRVVIAAQACVLLIALPQHDYFGELRSILVYPGAFHRGRERLFALPDEDAAEGSQVLLGESWSSGSVILAWKNALRGALNEDDGQNVVMHEFAHQLDQVDGRADGAPILRRRVDYKDWARVLGKDYEKLVKLTEAGRRDVIDAYGATNPAEFFAVATETFFERPRRLRKKHRELYDELKEYYGLDPAEWTG
ncbi:MAG: zinc-dependent peptidase [Verrucomicrobiota bacterium]